MTALIGLDLNGLWDWAAVHEEKRTDTLLKDLGVNASGVRLASNEEAIVVGPQTALAPHGRGQGWAALGHERLRLSHADMLRAVIDPDADVEAKSAGSLLATLVRSLAESARAVVIPVPDDNSIDEAARERMLQALHRARTPTPSLLWRPVAATLGWVGDSESSSESVHGLRVAVISVLRDSVHFGEVSLVEEKGRQGPLIVPERRQAGAVIWPDFGGASLARWVAERLAVDSDLPAAEILSGSRTPWTMAVGQTAQPELFRTINRSWRDLTAPVPPPCLNPPGTQPAPVIPRLADADLLLIEGPGAQASSVRLGVIVGLGLSPNDPRLVTLEPRAACRGALEASLRLRRGDPAYYDFLPQLSINALTNGEARFVSLVPPETRLRGGQIYRAEAEGDFAIGRGAHQLEFYLLKEDFDLARKSTVDLPEAADRQHRISVSVEQSPGQGFARVRIGSGTFAPLSARPIELDWTRMEVVQETPEEILASLQNDTGGAFPDTQVYPGHPVLWRPDSPQGDVRQALIDYAQTPLVERSRLTSIGVVALTTARNIAAKSVNPSFVGAQLGIVIAQTAPARFLNTDGGLPDARDELPVPDDADELLAAALDKAVLDYERVQKIPGADSELRAVIGLATWCYRRCPDAIVDDLLQWYEAGGAGVGGDLIVRLEGIGRVVHREGDAKRFYRAIERRLIGGLPIRNGELAALTRLLGGVDAAADWLSAEQANRFLQATQDLIEEQNNAGRTDAYKKKFKFAMLMLAVLLRKRRTQHAFLDPENHAAKALERLLVQAQSRMGRWIPNFRQQAARSRGVTAQRANATANRLEKVREIVGELVFFLHKEGRDPNIIQRIDALQDQ